MKDLYLDVQVSIPALIALMPCSLLPQHSLMRYSLWNGYFFINSYFLIALTMARLTQIFVTFPITPLTRNFLFAFFDPDVSVAATRKTLFDFALLAFPTNNTLRQQHLFFDCLH